MSYETEEQQVEALKEWWKENGTPLIIGAVLGLAGFAGWKYWSNQQIAYQAGASDLYNKVTEILNKEDKTGLVASAEAVKNQYPDSSYAILAAFHLAKEAVDNNELDKAAAELNWVIDNHASNEMVSVAKIRLARVLIQQDNATAALPLVELDEKSGYYALASLVKGDALLALDKKDEALTAYQAANSDLTIAARHPSLQLKIDELSTANTNTGALPEAVKSPVTETKSEAETVVVKETETTEPAAEEQK